MEFLKEILGEELYSQVAAKLEGNKEVKIGNLATGNYVDKGKYTTLEGQFKTAQDTLSQRDKDLEELKATMPKDQTETITTLQKKYDDDSKAWEAQLKQSKVSSAVAIALAKSGAKDDVAVKAHLTSFVEKAQYDDETGSIVGLDEQLKSLQKDKSYLFEDGLAGGEQHQNPPKKEPEDLGSALQDYYKQ